MKYFALVWENLSKPWQYFMLDYDTQEELISDIEESFRNGNIPINARIDVYKGEYIEVALERPE